MEEIWKDIEGYEGYYQVSNLGRVKSLRRWSGTQYYNREKIIKPWLTIKGYYRVQLSRNGVYKNFFLHRLVAEAFIPNPKNKPQVNHIDGNTKNYSISNLEWATARENVQHACDTGLKKNYGKKAVYQYDKNYNLIKKWDCIMDVERDLGYNNSFISSVCNGKYNSAYGYIWRHVND